MQGRTTRQQSQLAGQAQAPRRQWVVVTLLIIGGVVLLRLVLNLRYSMPPGMDAGYYPLQTRSLLERGELMGSTPPLIFWLDAALTRGLLLVSHLSLNQAAILATRIVDGIAHPWVAAAVMLLGYRWTGGRRSGLVIAACCSLLAVCSPPVMRMASDFQKNSLGLVWLAFSLWAMRETLRDPRPWRGLAVLMFVTLAGLSHIGAFGVTCVALAGMLAGQALLVGSFSGRQLCKTSAVIVASLVPAAGLVYWLAPQWAEHLLALPSRALGMLDFRLHAGQLIGCLLCWGLLALLLRRIWHQRDQMDADEQRMAAADRAVACGCVAALAVLTVPVLNATWTMRFQLMIPLPAAVLLLYCLTRLTRLEWQPMLSRCLVGMTAVVVVISPFFMQGPVISPATANELRAFAEQLDQPERTLVVAPHGLEFWVGLMTKTDVTSVGVPSARSHYEHILIVSPHHGPVGETGPQGHRNPPRRNPSQRNPPQQDHRHPPRRPDRHSPQESRITVPDDAARIHQGENFDVFEVW